MDDNPLGLGPKTVRWLGHRTVDVPDDRPSAADGEPVIPPRHTGMPSRVLGNAGPALSSFTGAIRVFGEVFRNPQLRRVELAFLGFNAAKWATWIALLVFAYEAGGAAAAGMIGAIQLIPAALFAPFASLLGDRYRRERVLLAGYVAQALAMGATAIALLAGAPLLTIYALAALAATSLTLTRPMQGALLPSLPRRCRGL